MNDPRKIRIRKDIDDLHISLMERILINWATPVDMIFAIPARWLAKHINAETPRTEMSSWKYVTTNKFDDYTRLVRIGQGGPVDSRAFELYNKTLCGEVMILTYNAFRRNE